jgi:hypothetical protein
MEKLARYRFAQALFTAVFLVCTALSVAAQSLYSAPTTSEGDRIRFLLDGRASQPTAIEIQALGRADNNVVALARGDRKRIDPTQFRGQATYLSDYHSFGVAWFQGRWQFGIQSTAADLYEGNHDAGQLYLDSLAHAIDLHSAAAPEATMNRSEINRLRIGRAFDFRFGRRGGVLVITGNLLDVHRFQVGSVVGTNTGGQFTGNLTILTTLGVPPSETRSPGASLDAAVSISLAPRWRAAATVDNLSGQVWQRKLQRLDVAVTTNSVEPDSNGFLHGIPLAQGRISLVSATANLQRRIDVGTAYSTQKFDGLLFISDDFDWRVAAGLNFRSSRGSQVWALFGLSPFEWQLGYGSSRWRIQIGMSATDFEQAKRASAAVTLRVPLGRSRANSPIAQQ